MAFRRKFRRNRRRFNRSKRRRRRSISRGRRSNYVYPSRGGIRM